MPLPEKSAGISQGQADNGGAETRLEQLGVHRNVEIPFEFGVITETMYWHPRMESDAAHRWLRDRITALAASLERVASQ